MIISHPSARLKQLLSFLTLLAIFTSPDLAQARDPVPPPDQQKKIEKLLEETYGLDRLTSSSKKSEAIKTLSAAASSPDLPADERYVVLLNVIRLSRETGDMPRWLAAVSLLTSRFEVDQGKEKARLMANYLDGVRSSSALKTVAEHAVEIAVELAQTHDYAVALGVLEDVEKAASRIADKNSPKLVAEPKRAIEEQNSDYVKQMLARKSLIKNPDDPLANHAVGRWLAIYEEDWSQAKPFLAKSNDEKWKSATQAEINMLSDADSQLATADAWFDISKSVTGNTKGPLMRHTASLYEAAASSTKSPIVKTRISQRLKELGPVAKVETPVIKPAVPPSTTGTPSVDNPAAEWIDLLGLTDGIDWAPRGIDWNSRVEGKLASGVTLRREPKSTFPLAAIVDGDYDLETEFTRQDGEHPVGIVFPVGIHLLQLEFGAEDGKIDGVSFIRGKPLTNPENPTSRRPSVLRTGERCRLTIRVRTEGAEASFRVDCNGATDYIKWNGPATTLAYGDDTLRNVTMIRHVWLISDQSRTTFHNVRIRMVSGTVRRDAITDADRDEDLKKGIVRLVGQKIVQSSAVWSKAYVSQMPLEMSSIGLERTWPLITQDFKPCEDFYGAHGPSRIDCPIPANAKSFSVIGYNDATRSSNFRILIDGKPVHESGITGSIPIKIAIPPRATQLQLVVDPGENNQFHHSYWCYPRFHTVPVEKVQDKALDNGTPQLRFSVVSSKVAYGSLTHNLPIDAKLAGPIRFRDMQPCDEFLFAHAPSSITYAVPEGMTRFTAIGYKLLFHQHVKFELWADGSRIFQSPVAGLIPIDVRLPPKTKSIELKVDDLGNRSGDLSIWCFPQLHRQ